jgi:dTDP-4-amino-4,6-dideoxy-D-galactose acyltransferase
VNRLAPEIVQSARTWCEENGVQCLYFLAACDDPVTVRLAEDNGFRLVDIRLTMTRDTASPELGRNESAGVVVRRHTEQDVPQLRRIARISYADSRFCYDRHFSKDRCGALYETWIEKSCRGDADLVLVAELAGEPIGYVTGHREGRAAGRIGLVGVHSGHHGLHAGHALVAGAVEWFAERGVRQVSVVTQGRNVRAQRLYQRCGFITSSVELWYHRWFTPPANGSGR